MVIFGGHTPAYRAYLVGEVTNQRPANPLPHRPAVPNARASSCSMPWVDDIVIAPIVIGASPPSVAMNHHRGAPRTPIRAVRRPRNSDRATVCTTRGIGKQAFIKQTQWAWTVGLDGGLSAGLQETAKFAAHRELLFPGKACLAAHALNAVWPDRQQIRSFPSCSPQQQEAAGSERTTEQTVLPESQHETAVSQPFPATDCVDLPHSLATEFSAATAPYSAAAQGGVPGGLITWPAQRHAYTRLTYMGASLLRAEGLCVPVDGRRKRMHRRLAEVAACSYRN
ncbi:hypothetical protein PG997_001186 [Apiospora hydei]|uniref:Uncharacterized protein n=1 Tax=Apiospora hydei TaxID=1337664 RepID=A0ABR1XCZ1_9PEZI